MSARLALRTDNGAMVLSTYAGRRVRSAELT
jgi:hypothetical protein